MKNIKELAFAKYQGLGNDFIILQQAQIQDIDPADLAQRVCDRHFGIGADGLVVLAKASDLRMIFYNSDGSEAPMCGNASRCVAHYAIEHQMVSKNSFVLQTAGGNLPITYHANGLVTVNLGQPKLQPAEIPACWAGGNMIDVNLEINGQPLLLSAVNTTTPHAVVFVNDLDLIDIADWGQQIENHELFPSKINANFVQIIDQHTVRQITWERGAGQTLACGTGACATTVAGVLSGRLAPEVEVHMTGGSLHISYDKTEILMTGGVDRIAAGIYYYVG